MVEKIQRKSSIVPQPDTQELIYSSIGWIYDNPLYMSVIALFGPVIGGGLMTLGSLIISFFLILWYNQRKVDWIGVNAIDALKELSLRYVEKLAELRTDSFIGTLFFIVGYIPIRVVLSALRFANHRIYGNVMAFILLSIFEDPFITTAYLRHGYYGLMTHRDWLIFFASVILSNGYWVLRTTAVIQLAQALTKFF